MFAALSQRIPVAIQLGLALAHNLERQALVEADAVVDVAVHGDYFAAGYHEATVFHRVRRPFAGSVALNAVDASAREDARVVAHRLFGPAMLRPREHQARRDDRSTLRATSGDDLPRRPEAVLHPAVALAPRIAAKRHQRLTAIG